MIAALYLAHRICVMKPMIYAFFLLLVLGPGSALAACSGTQLNESQIASLLTGRTACYPVGGPPWTNQEAHSGGTITDYKQGSASSTDPTTQVGSYSIAPPGTLTYNYYGGGTPYIYTVW